MTMSFINENTLRVVFETPEEEEQKKDCKVKLGMIFEILEARAGYIDYRVNEKINSDNKSLVNMAYGKRINKEVF